MALRFAVLILATVCLSLIYANITILNFCKNCFIKDNVTQSNGSIKITFAFSGTQESTLLSAVAWGSLLSALPASWLLHRYGARIVFSAFGFLSAVVTVAMPLVIFLPNHNEYIAFLILAICRVLQGVALGSCFPVLATVTANWAPISEMGLFIGILASFIQIAPVMTNPVAGLFCGTIVYQGWPMVYWIFGFATLVAFFLWIFIYRNNPQSHPWSSQALIENRSEQNSQNTQAVPYKSIFGSAAVWAIIVASLGNMFGVQLFVLYTPTYLKKVLNFADSKTGFLAALPNMVQFILKVVAGVVSDKIKCCKETIKIKIFNSIALFGMAIFLLALAFVNAEYRTLTVVFLVGAPAIIGAHSGGFFKSASLVAGQYSAFVMSCIQISVCLAMALVPYIVGALVPVQFMNDQNKWKTVFIIHSVLLFICNVVFCIFASGEPAAWSKVTDKNELPIESETAL